MIFTSDTLIRFTLKNDLLKHHANDKKVRIIEEMAVSHGNARIDIAVVNGIMHGYEIKSDRDKLQRLPGQMQLFNSVFDKVTLVVGKNHLYDAINIIPDWWGIIVAKICSEKQLGLYSIREGENNPMRDSISLARLLWKDEALKILETADAAKGLYSKTREFIYQRLSTVFDQDILAEKVREAIVVRTNWRPDAPLILSGD